VSIVALARAAVACDHCFSTGELRRGGIGVPEPFIIGRKYWAQPTRVVLLGVKPFAEAASRFRQVRSSVLERLRAGDAAAYEHSYPLAAEKDAPLWRNGRFIKRIRALGVDLPDIALGHIALCATYSDSTPIWMLSECFIQHTCTAIQQSKRRFRPPVRKPP
jgi:hypothetical protein